MALLAAVLFGGTAAASDATLSAPRLVGDLVPGSDLQAPRGTPFPFRAVGSRALFELERDGGRQIWGSDGSDAGTEALLLGPGGGTTYFSWPHAGGVALWQEPANGEGLRLYVTDGTSAGTRLIATYPQAVFPGWYAAGATRSWFTVCYADPERYRCELFGLASREGARPRRLATDVGLALAGYFDTPVVGDRLVFFADHGHGLEVWVSKGTPASTVPLITLPKRAREVGWLGKREGRVFWWLSDDSLWTSDGTLAGTGRLRGAPAARLYPHAWPAEDSAGPLFLASTAVGAKLTDLWALSAAGSLKRLGAFTAVLYDIWGPGVRPVGPTGTAARFVFAAKSPGSPYRLWVTDGTPAGTRALPAGAKEAPAVGRWVGRLGDRQLFLGSDPRQGAEVWITDGTARGTRRLTDACPGACGVETGSSGALDGGLAAFPLSVGGRDSWWRTDGTSRGTYRVARLGVDAFAPYGVRYVGPPTGAADESGTHRLFFGALDGDDGVLWVSDGTVEGTRSLDLSLAVGRSSSPTPLGFLGGWPLVSTIERSPLGETAPVNSLVWVRGDGWRTIRLPLGVAPSGAGFANAGGDVVLFRAFDAGDNVQMWRTDGTPAGTYALTALNLESAGADRLPNPEANAEYGECYSSVGPALWAGNAWRFVSSVCDSGGQLWETDGTWAGTRRLEVVPRGALGVWLLADAAFFTAPPAGAAAGEPPSLYRVDLDSPGGPPVAAMEGVAGLAGASAWAHPESGRLILQFQGGEGVEVWVSDGTAAGTRRFEFSLGADARPLTEPLEHVEPVAQYALTWALHPGDNLRVLVRLDLESARGVTLHQPAAVDLAVLTEIQPLDGGGAVFVGWDAQHGFEPWTTDGTATGTRLLCDVSPGPSWSRPRGLTASEAAGGVFFAATDLEHGEEPWFTDGTNEGTGRAGDLWPGEASSSPRDFFAGPDAVLFSADDGVHGREPWEISW